MEFIESMKEVWMASEMRKREEREWRQIQEERQWARQNPMARGREQRHYDDDDDDDISTTCQASSAPSMPSRLTRDSNTSSNSRESDVEHELNNVLRQMDAGFGSLEPTIAEGDDPPEYCNYHNVSTALPIGPPIVPPPRVPLTTSTNVKAIARQEDTAPATSDNSKSPISDTSVKKTMAASGCARDDNSDTMTAEEKSEVLEMIKKLTEEQNLLKSKMKEHDEHLSSLLKKEPTFSRRLSKNANRIMLTSKVTPFNPGAMKTNTLPAALMNQDKIYAQIEQLYANICRMHFPLEPTMAMKCLTQNDNQIYSGPSANEVALMMENKNLREQVERLQKRLDESTEEKDRTQAVTVDNDEDPHYYEDAEIQSLKFTDHRRVYNIKQFTETENKKSPTLFQLARRDVQQVKATFEWTISNYLVKLDLEKRGKSMDIVSEPFLIGQYGYLARLEIYLNGNGAGHNKCMSVFVRIIKGDYDEFLEWPAVFSMTFKLINQEPTFAHSLMSSRNGTIFTFDKPTGVSFNQSDCWGIIEFVPHAVITERNYIKNDTIKLRVEIANR